MIKDDCIFCKLANGIFDTNTVYEDENFRVILDIAPAAKGHCLVLPKKHFENALVADEDTLGKGRILAAKIGKKVKEAYGCDGINIVQNNGEAAGQTVFHLHIHVIPRYNDDTVKFEYDSLELKDEDFKEALTKLKQILLMAGDGLQPFSIIF